MKEKKSNIFSIFSFIKPKNKLEDGDIKKKKRAAKPIIPNNMAEKCEQCGNVFFLEDIKVIGVCPCCGHYSKLTARERIDLVATDFMEFFTEHISQDPLSFPEYSTKLKQLQDKTGEKDAVVCGIAKIGAVKTAIFSMEYRMLMGSMGQVVGEKITALFEYATRESLPVVGFILSGGARMQEGIVSLMQMAKTSAAVAKHSEAGLLYISVLTNPTMGGVSASFAFQADIIMAERGAIIGFAGPRVIEQTIRQVLPNGFQQADFLEAKGFIDVHCAREELQEKLSLLLKYHEGGSK